MYYTLQPVVRTIPISVLCCVLTATAILFASEAAAVEDDLNGLYQRTQKLREEMYQSQRRYEAQIDALEKRVMELEKSADNHPQSALPIEDTAHNDATHQPQRPLEWSLSGLVAMGGSSADADELLLLEGGSHDPRKNGFTLQALALAVHASLGAHLDATASIVSHIEPDGESVVELEQAYLRSTNQPQGLSTMLGQFFLDFGEENKRHADDWDFVDVPFLITRLFGSDKLRSQGVQLVWDAPLTWPSSVYLGAYNPNGETATSFLYKPGEVVGGHVLQARGVEGLDDLLYLLKWSHRFPAGTREHLGLGISGLFGPNASGSSTDTQTYGLDLEWTRYRSTQDRQPLFDWRTEIMYRRYEAGDSSNPDHEILTDYGAFTQAVWQFCDNWMAGLRAEYADSNKGSGDDPLRDRRKRFSVNLTHPFAQYVKWRLQYNHDRADYLSGGNANSAWLQLVYQAGEHDEH